MAHTKHTCRPYKPTHREIIVALRAQAAALQRERAFEAARWREAETAPDGTVDLTEELSDSAAVSDDDVVEVAPPAAAAPVSWERAACSDLTNADLTEAYMAGAVIKDLKKIDNTDWTDIDMRKDQRTYLCSIAKGTNPKTGMDTRDTLMCK